MEAGGGVLLIRGTREGTIVKIDKDSSSTGQRKGECAEYSEGHKAIFPQSPHETENQIQEEGKKKSYNLPWKRGRKRVSRNLSKSRSWWMKRGQTFDDPAGFRRSAREKYKPRGGGVRKMAW